MRHPLKTVTLEMSFKPFKDGFAPDNVAKVLRELFRQWDALTRHAEAIQVMLWTSDGSEILEYTGDLDAEMAWAQYIGGANRSHTFEYDPKREALHARHYDYCANPPRLTYRLYRDVIAAIKRIGCELTGKRVTVGATFDPGPEFAKSRFKYEWHPEICLGASMGAGTMVCCYASLKGDTRNYAAFPKGIPDGLPFGTFLGRQSKLFTSAMGFDYLWLSNGFGFGMETWGVKGAVFDGTKFDAARRHECGTKNLEFWNLLRAELPDLPLETRGTNLLTGTDIGGDGVPLREIYRGGFGIQSPPNSPWAALNHDYGLELAGWMSHIAELPPDNQTILYRYYIHDPWWLNSPWLDRYGREAHDIFLPGAVARLDGKAQVRIADHINILTVDDSLGDMPERVPNEVTPHLLECRRTAPDQAGPLVWSYPFDEYHDHAFGAEGAMETPWFGDWLIHSAINDGLPLNTVVSTGNLVAGLATDPAAYAGRILVTPVPQAGDPLDAVLPGLIASGAKVLLYGPTAKASDAMRKLIGVAAAPPIHGTCTIELAVADDTCARPAPTRVVHRELLNLGGCAEVAAGARVLATLSQGEERRAVATVNRRIEWKGGTVAWVRGTNGCTYKGGHLPDPDSAADTWPAERLLRLALGEFGWSIRMGRSAADQPGHSLTVHRSDNGWWFAGLARSTNVPLRLRCPDGAPLLLGHEAWLEDGHAVYHLPRAWRREVRVFVDQAQGGEIACVEGTHEQMGTVRRFWVKNLKDANVVIYPEAGRTATVLCDPVWPFFLGQAVEHTVEDGGRRIVCHHVTGNLSVIW
jgi:hypothetical protein